MTVERAVGAAWWSWKAGFVASHKLSTWAPLAATTVVRFAALLLVTFFHRPEIVGLGRPLVEFFGGAEASHYPEHLFRLPIVFAGIDPWILIFVGGPTALAVTRSLIKTSIAPDRFPLARNRHALLASLLIAALAVGLAAGVGAAFQVLPDSLQDRGGKLGLAIAMARSGLLVLVLSPLLCGFAAIVVHAESFLAAIQRSVRIASTQPITVLLVTAWPVALTLPFDVLSGPIGRSRFESEPEAMLVVIASGLLVQIVAAHVTLAAATRIVLWTASEE